MVEVEAVRGGGLPGAGGILPPKPCSLIGVGQLQHAGKDQRAAGLGYLVGDEVGHGGGGGVGDEGFAQGPQVFSRRVGLAGLVGRFPSGLGAAVLAGEKGTMSRGTVR
ncbi:hypothetical protein SAV14893_097880 [Streptomyces avermitilis]|uniref:Uncharacterized protein n=1 Tax=Streptomyces avermitilis TaxID=33903 RepID=A0A4D4MF34_STRAX|nr:hypothetical protein SAV14893_097880 [Streptomyces avermitilis]